MRAFAIALVIGISHHAAAQTPADLVRLIGPGEAPLSVSAPPRTAVGAGEFGPNSLVRLVAPTGAVGSANTSPAHVSMQAFGAADLARLRGGEFDGWGAWPSAAERVASALGPQSAHAVGMTREKP